MGGGLDIHELMNISYIKTNNIQNFVETGTYKAQTTKMAATLFETVYSTEIDNRLYKDALTTCKDLKNVNLLYGDSLDLLQIITPNVVDGSVFFLDAHVSGADSSWNGTDRVPLMEEINIILSHKLGPSVFILDDVRFWKNQSQTAWDWEHICVDTILDNFSKNGYEVQDSYISNDRFFIII